MHVSLFDQLYVTYDVQCSCELCISSPMHMACANGLNGRHRAWGMQGAEGGDGSGKGGRGLHSKLRPTSGSQVLNHDPQSGVVLVPKVCSANSPFPPGTALLHAHLHLVFGLSTLLIGMSQRQCMVLCLPSQGVQHDRLTEVTMLQVYVLMKILEAGVLSELVHA